MGRFAVCLLARRWDNDGPTKVAGITLRQSSFVLVDRCAVIRAGNNGILLHGGPELPKVNSCTIQNCVVSDLGGNDGIVIHQDARATARGIISRSAATSRSTVPSRGLISPGAAMCCWKTATGES
ncbi:MAG: hypothetical protein FJ399_09130 [Verrucomicrobia bacterium]|nr:hypothetical protein [Verrucomicrobiota bacterium]